MLDTAKKELPVPEISSASKTVIPTKPNSQRRRKSSSSRSPVRLRNTRRRSSGHADDDADPEQQLLRNLGLALPTAPIPIESHVETLERALSERVSRLEEHAKSLQSTTESSISSHLLDAHITLQLLKNSLLAQSPYNEVQLVESEVESRLSLFEQDIQALQKRLEAVDLQKLQSKNVHRDALIERWSR